MWIFTFTPNKANIATKNAGPNIQGKGNNKRLKQIPPKIPINKVFKIRLILLNCVFPNIEKLIQKSTYIVIYFYTKKLKFIIFLFFLEKIFTIKLHF